MILDGEWECVPTPPPPAFERAVFLWAQYEVACEEFDRQFPGGFEFDPDSWQPHFHQDRRECSVHAFQRRQALRDVFLSEGIPDETVTAAKQLVQRLTFKQQQEIVAMEIRCLEIEGAPMWIRSKK